MSIKHQVQPFNYNGHQLSTVTDDKNEVWFIAKEVAEILGYAQTNNMNKLLEDSEKKKINLQIGGNYQNQSLISESGLYTAIFGSTLPEAKPFKKWVTSEVLPSIRKTGGYTSQKIPSNATPNNGLMEFRKAKALQLAEETAAKICERFPKLGEASQQVIFAKIINPIAGAEVLMLPRVDERLLMAGQVGDLLGVSANRIGRLANMHSMKTSEFGEFRLDKSVSSSKQVEVFHYNQKAIDKLRILLLAHPEAA